MTLKSQTKRRLSIFERARRRRLRRYSDSLGKPKKFGCGHREALQQRSRVFEFNAAIEQRPSKRLEKAIQASLKSRTMAKSPRAVYESEASFARALNRLTCSLYGQGDDATKASAALSAQVDLSVDWPQNQGCGCWPTPQARLVSTVPLWESLLSTGVDAMRSSYAGGIEELVEDFPTQAIASYFKMDAPRLSAEEEEPSGVETARWTGDDPDTKRVSDELANSWLPISI